MSTWIEDKGWSDQFIPEIKMIIGCCLIVEDKEEDMKRNGDLVMLKVNPVRVSCRVRRDRYCKKPYLNEFTMRGDRLSGTKSELTKVLEGWGDYNFYGFSSYDESHLQYWTLMNLGIFREYVDKYGIERLGKQLKNVEGSSFWVFSMNNFPDNFVIARSTDKEWRRQR